MKSTRYNKSKIIIITSSGGHLFLIHKLEPWWKNYQRIWVTRNDLFTQELLKKEKIYFGCFPENRNLVNFVKNIFLAIKILYTEKPDFLFSTGAGIAPPFFLIAKIFGIKTIFMEFFSIIPHTTISGKIIYHLADLFLVQNKELLKVYSKAKYFGRAL